MTLHDVRDFFLQRSYERLSSEVLDAASAPVRLQVLKLLSSKGPLPYTEIMYASKLDPVRDAGKFVYHLKTLRKAGLVNVEKGTKKYGITELGKVLVEFSRDLEEYLAVKRGRLFVRTSRMTIEEFDRTRIASSLVKEAGMPQSLANEIATEAEERLLKISTSYLTAPLIRELVNTILVERKLDEYRHKLTRLGLPVNDVTILLKEASARRLDPGWVERSAGTAVTEEYVLLNSLPRDLVDAHLSGQRGPGTLASCAIHWTGRKTIRSLRVLSERVGRALSNCTRGSSRNKPHHPACEPVSNSPAQ